MAQSIRFNYLDNDATLDINEAKASFLSPGVYRGYSVDLSSAVGMDLTLSTSGGAEFTYTQRDTDPNPGQLATTLRSCLVTKQLVEVQEDEDITGIAVNPGHATLPRIDLMVCEHEYVFAQGASQAIYFVIQGTPDANPVPPALTQPEIQVVIGQIYVPATTTQLSDPGVVYSPSPVPAFAEDPTIVRTFNEQVITGTKTLNGVKFDFGEPATFNAGTIDLPSIRFAYYLEATGTPSTYVTVSAITDYGNGHNFTILTDQRLKIVEGGSIGVGNGTQFFVEVGESVSFVNVGGLPGFPPAPFFIATKEGDANKSHTVKMYATLKQNKPSFTSVPGSVSGSALFIPQTGNYFDVDIPNPQSVGFISHLPSMYHGGDAVPNVQNEGGTRIQLRYTNSKNLTVQHNAGSTPANYKPIFIPNSLDVTFNTPTVLELVEDSTHWRLVNVTSSAMNPVTAYLNDVSHSADIATLFASIKYRKLHSWYGSTNMTSAGTTTLETYTVPGGTLANVGDSLRVTLQYLLSRNNNQTKAVVATTGSALAEISDNSALTSGLVSVLIVLDLTLTAPNSISRTMLAHISDYNSLLPEDVVEASPYMVLGTDTDNVTTITTASPIPINAQGTLVSTGNVVLKRFVVELFKI